MIFAFLVISLITVLWLPWWALCPLCFAFGFLQQMRWKNSALFALLIAIAEFGLAFYFDHRDQGLMSLRLGGLLHVPHGMVYLLPAGIGAWIALFFTRLGTSVRRLVG